MGRSLAIAAIAAVIFVLAQGEWRRPRIAAAACMPALPAMHHLAARLGFALTHLPLALRRCRGRGRVSAWRQWLRQVQRRQDEVSPLPPLGRPL